MSGKSKARLSATAAIVSLSRDGVDELAPLGNHVEAARYLAVEHIRESGDGDDQRGPEEAARRIGREVDGEIHGYQDKPEIAQQVRYGEIFAF